MIENRVPAGWAGPFLHHHAFDEAFYVLGGELTTCRQATYSAGRRFRKSRLGFTVNARVSHRAGCFSRNRL
jgi:uncharacterized cupin superfamily protein